MKIARGIRRLRKNKTLQIVKVKTNYFSLCQFSVSFTGWGRLYAANTAMAGCFLTNTVEGNLIFFLLVQSGDMSKYSQLASEKILLAIANHALFLHCGGLLYNSMGRRLFLLRNGTRSLTLVL